MDVSGIIAALDAVLNNPQATPEEMAAAIQAAREALQAMVDAGGTSSAEEVVKSIDAVSDAIKKANTRMEAKQKLDAFKTENAKLMKAYATPATAAPNAAKVDTKSIKIGFAQGKTRHFESDEAAYKSGMWLVATLGKQGSEAQAKAAQWVREHGVKGMTESNDTSAGVLVPEEMEYAVWSLREKYGVARGAFNVITGTSESVTTFKRTNDLTTYFIGEGAEPTESQLNYQKNKLTAKTLATLTKYSGLLNEDSAIRIADEIANSAAFALALKEDQCAFIGDGSSTYGGMVGANYKHRLILEAAGGTWTTDADKAKLGGAQVATGATWASVTKADIMGLMGKVNVIAGMQPFFRCSSVFYYEVMLPLLTAQGGATQTELVNGVSVPMWSGYPVEFTQVMPQVTAVSTVPLLFGDLKMAGDFFDRRGITIAQDESLGFKAGDIYVRTSERFDVNTHDAGNYHATAASRTRGTIAALILKNS